jgi:cytochrome b pre-mRNA-processing protein 3
LAVWLGQMVGTPEPLHPASRLVNLSPIAAHNNAADNTAPMLSLFRRKSPLRESAEKLYSGVVEQARRPEFYTALGVPDTADGRFDLIALHAYLVLRRLKREPEAGSALAQTFFDHMFMDVDRNLREMGVGDLSVGRHIKAMAEGFYGRIAAYDVGLAGSDEALTEALDRNLYRNATAAPAALAAIAVYLKRESGALDRAPLASLLKGEISFGSPPEMRP